MSIQGYVGALRALVGTSPVNFVGAAGLIVDARGHLLLGRRVGSQTWGLPTGISELGEALPDTLRREVMEETGLHVHAADLLDMVSGAETFRTLPNGDQFYAYTALYHVTSWSGTPQPDGVEISELAFFAPEALPALAGSITRRALDFL